MPSPRAADDARRPSRSRHRTRQSRAALAGAVTLVTLLTGCTGDPASEPTPTRTASATPTPEPTPTPTTMPAPERPAAMDDPGVDGAVAAATYFVSLFPYVYETGDLAAWKELSHPECIFCASVATRVGEMHAQGNHQVGPAITIHEAVGREVDPGVFFAVDVRMSQGPITELGPNGSVVDEELASQELDVSLAVIRDGERWIIRGSEATDASE